MAEVSNITNGIAVISNETKKKVRYGLTTTQKAIISSRSTIETPQKGVKHVQS